MKNPKLKEWTPVARGGGEIYCSPACGHGCTMAEHDEAIRKARTLALKLGKGWRPEIWENMGWYWAVVNGGLKVHPTYSIRGRVTGFMAFVGDPDSPGGRWVEHGETPKEAISKVLAVAKAEIKALETIVRAAEAAA
ncbi:MAG: hypothetical protein L0191_07960 [Acidobacteria bacterium]|nr:hypothetical protein [Acidobacteriota bacterium]